VYYPERGVMDLSQEQATTPTQRIVGIQFRRSGKVYDFDPGPFVLKRDDKVVVITEEGPSIGIVSVEPHGRGEEDSTRTLKKIFRLATPDEIQKFEVNCTQEKTVYEYWQSEDFRDIASMCLVSVERHYDGSKIIVYFTADGRVDFRELVKDLVQQFRCRIEMRRSVYDNRPKWSEGLDLAAAHCVVHPT